MQIVSLAHLPPFLLSQPIIDSSNATLLFTSTTTSSGGPHPKLSSKWHRRKYGQQDHTLLASCPSLLPLATRGLHALSCQII